MEPMKSEMVTKDTASIQVGKTPKPGEEHPTATAIKIGGHLLGFFHLPGGMDVRQQWDEFKAKNANEGDKPHAFPIMFPGFLGLEPDADIKASKTAIELEI